MGPIGSKVIEVKGQICFWGRSSPNLEGRWRAAPDISLRGSFFERSRSSRSKVKFVFFSVCSPTSPRSLGRSSPNLVGRWRAAPYISSRGSFLKVKVIEVKGQRSNFCISAVLRPIWMKLGECIQVDIRCVLFVFIAAIILLLR